MATPGGAWSFYFPKILTLVYILFVLIHHSILIVKYPHQNGPNFQSDIKQKAYAI